MSAPRYNEAFDDCGRLRAAYRAFAARTGRDDRSPHLPDPCAPAAIGGRYAIAPVPLVLADAEHAVLAKAVLQRGLALQRLFLDLVRGDAGVLRNTDVPEDVVDEILPPAGEGRDAWTRVWRGQELEAVRFIYAPDLVRAPDGHWLVLEDNVGCVGGVVDANLVVERLCACLDVSLHPSVPRGSSFEQAVVAFLIRAGTPPAATTAAAMIRGQTRMIRHSPCLIGSTGPATGPGHRRAPRRAADQRSSATPRAAASAASASSAASFVALRCMTRKEAIRAARSGADRPSSNRCSRRSASSRISQYNSRPAGVNRISRLRL